MKKLLSLVTILISFQSIHAQEPADALRYAQSGNGGTARSRAIGGAIVGLGGDISTATVNPAGLALYKTNEFVFTPEFSFGKTSVDYLTNATKQNNISSQFSTLGMIIARPGSMDGKWRNFTFGFGMNKPISYNNTTHYKGNNLQSSFSEKYLEELINNGVTDPNAAAQNFPYGSSLAFNTYLIDTVSGPGNTVLGYKSLATPQTGVTQDMKSVSKGFIQETYFAGSANLEDKLYLGASIVISKLKFERTNTFREADATQNKLNNFNYFEAEEYLLSDGMGLGVKLGLIFKPIERLRIGAAYHSPTLYNMTDHYSTKITTDMEGYTSNKVLTQSSLDLNSNELGQFQYNLTNPSKLMFGASFVLHEVEDVTKQRGFISADIEFLDYSNSKFSAYTGSNSTASSASYLNNINTAINEQFKSAMNIRVGGELKFNTIMGRLGFNYMGSPYAVSDLKGNQMNISGGLGYRDKGVFIDLTYVQRISKGINFPYKLDNGFYEPGYVKNSYGNVSLTVGFKF